MPPRKQKPGRSSKKTAIVPRIVVAGTLTAVIPVLSACSGGMMGPDAISLDVGTYDTDAPDFGMISLDAGTFDTSAPDHGIADAPPDNPIDTSPDLIISLDAGTFDTGAPDLGFETGPDSTSG